MQPSQVFSLAVDTPTADGRLRLRRTLSDLSSEDSSVVTYTNGKTGQSFLLAATEEKLLRVARTLILRADDKVLIGSPSVFYEETITEAVERAAAHMPGNARAHSAQVIVDAEPTGRGSDFVLRNRLSFAPEADVLAAAEAGIMRVAASGVLAGYPLTDMTVTLVEIAFEPRVATYDMLRAAGEQAMRAAVRTGGPRILEPVMTLDVLTPGAFADDVVADLEARRATIDRVATRGDSEEVVASVPLSELFGYRDTLLHITRGHAVHSMQFARCQVLPKS